MKNINKFPADYDCFMPGEFGEHRATWILWPERTDIWRLGAKPAQAVFVQIADIISQFEQVVVGVNQSQYENARVQLSKNIQVIEISFDDAWIRDTGPTFVLDRENKLHGVDWFFNAWGGIGQISEIDKWDLMGSYFPWKLDDMVARKILEIEKAKRHRCPLILEGGAIHTNGKGTLLAVKECILSRNSNYTFAKIEELLKRFLGINKFIWLKQGLYLEENNGHIDNMCCFVDANTILLNWCNDKNDPQYDISNEAYEVLINAKDSKGIKFNIIKVIQPPALHITEEESQGIDSSEYSIPRAPNDRLPASYVNSYFVNGAVLIPSFSSTFDESPAEYDKAAKALYLDIFKDRKIIQIPARELLLGGGGIHCIVQQIPKHK